MKSGIRNVVALLIFLSVLMLLVGSHSKALDLFLGLGLYVIGSAVVLLKTLTEKPGDSYSRLGWGNQLSALPSSWQRWLLDETHEAKDRNNK